MDLHPDQLLDATGLPRPLGLVPLRASELAERYGLALVGEDREIGAMGGLATGRAGLLGYLGAERYAAMLAGREGLVVITTAALQPHVPAGHTILVSRGEPKETLYSLFADAVREGRYERLAGYVSPQARISPHAVLEDHVHVAAGAEIGPGVVVQANTYVGPEVRIKPNSTIGGDGFEVAMVHGKRRVVPHAGGVWLSAGVEIGSSCCVDRSVFGEFTYLGPDCKFDNFVHFAHNCHAGAGCYFTAGTEISGSVTIGEGVWFAPSTSVKNGVTIGSHVFTGLAAVITGDLPPHALAFGFPAKVRGLVCRCRARLEFVDEQATCTQCGARFEQRDERVVPAGV